MKHFQHPDCQEISLHRPRAGRIFSTRMDPRCHGDIFSVGNSATQQTAQNRQTTVQAGTSAVVTGSGNTGVASSSGVITNGNNNKVTITTADPAIVQSALDTNSLIATEALTTYDHLVTGQTAGQLQAQSESQANDDALTGFLNSAASQVAPAPAATVDNSPDNEGNTGTSGLTASKILTYVSIAAAVATAGYYVYLVVKKKKG